MTTCVHVTGKDNEEVEVSWWFETDCEKTTAASLNGRCFLAVVTSDVKIL